MTLISRTLDVEGLKELYSSGGPAAAILKRFAAGKGNKNRTELVRLSMDLRESGQATPSPKLIRFLRRLEALGCGKFITGRKGHPTRFEWNYSPSSVGIAAAGVQPIEQTEEANSAKIAEESAQEAAVDTDTIEHRYRLRADWIVELQLPSDLTTWEATRLSDFIRTLPFSPTPVNFGDLTLYKPTQ
jgi:hypothetical protein